MDNKVAQVVLVEDIRPRSFDGYFSSNPVDLEELNGKLYFTANDGETGNELWVSDGTAEGTNLVADINPGNSNDGFNYYNVPGGFAELNGKLYFGADDGENGKELWVTDGTAEGTQLVADIDPGIYAAYSIGSYPRYFTEFGGKLYFGANDSKTGNELWVTDGTAEGTQLVADINPGTDSYSGYANESNPYGFTKFNGKLYFGANDGEAGGELWVTDGTAEGTNLVADINPGSAGSYFQNLAEFNGKLYFSANDGENGNELWVTDGTAEGTQLVADINLADINLGSDSSFPGGFTEFDGKLYFGANDSKTGNELWVTDGTAEGTQLVADINPGSAGSDPKDLTVVDNELFFAADNGEVGTELFKLTFDGDVTSNIIGTDGNDNLVGTSEDDTIEGLAGKDSIDGGDGNDSIIGGGGRDSLNGQNGNDTIIGGDAIDLIFGGDGDDSLVGELGNDRIEGGSGNDVLLGDRGFDNLVGGDGDDTISGGRDRDTIDGGLGDDVLSGGFGGDTFVLQVGDGEDLIADFRAGTDLLGLAGGLQYEALVFEGNNILSDDKLLVTLEGVDTQQLSSDSFEAI